MLCLCRYDGLYSEWYILAVGYHHPGHCVCQFGGSGGSCVIFVQPERYESNRNSRMHLCEQDRRLDVLQHRLCFRRQIVSNIICRYRFRSRQFCGAQHHHRCSYRRRVAGSNSNGEFLHNVRLLHLRRSFP